MTMGEMKEHVKNADQQGNLWCHLEGCRGTCTTYRVNIWQQVALEHRNREQPTNNLQVHRKRIRAHIQANHDTDSNGWYNVGTCEGSYQAYQINIWGIQKPDDNG